MTDPKIPYQWTSAIHLFAHTNNYDLQALKEGLAENPAAYEVVRRQFDEVLRTRPVTVEWYAEHANDVLEDEEELYRYLQEMYDYLFNEGPWPTTGY